MALKITVNSGTTMSALARNRSNRADLILLNFAGARNKDVAVLDAAMNGTLSKRIKAESFDARDKSVRIVDTALTVPGLDRVVLAGLGTRGDLSPDSLRTVLVEIFTSARDYNCERIVLPLPEKDFRGISVAQFAAVLAEVACLVDYEPNHQKTRPWRDESEQTHFRSIVLLTGKENLRAVKQAVQQSVELARATNDARNWVNEPSNTCTPQRLATLARKIARDSGGLVKCKVLKMADIKNLGMGAFLAVNSGSKNPPVLIDMRYDPPGGKTKDVLGLIGKGITFDSGGLGIKDGDNMRDMKDDMGGAAAVLATMSLIKVLKPAVSVRAIVAATENLVDATSMRPGDIIKSMSGLTIEVAHTDAEGRLTLADALHYAQTLAGATQLIDLATLTGSVEEALGSLISGVFTNNDRFAARFMDAAKNAGEPMHVLPMLDDYRDGNRSDMADLNNDGSGPGAIVAAWFLREFVLNETPWIHVDIAGTSFRRYSHGLDPVGASGVGVRTLARLLHSYQ